MHLRLSKVIALILASTAEMVLSGPVALAEECNPINFLQPETIKSVSDITTKIAYVDSFIRQKSNDKNAHFVNDVYSGYGISNMDVNYAEKANERIKTMLDLKLDQRKQDWLLISTLSQTGADAYKNCLVALKKNISITFSQNAMTSDKFFLTVHSHPQAPTDSPLDIEIRALDGFVEDSKSTRITDKIKPQGKKAFAIYRDLSKALDINITIGDDSETVSFPAAPSRKLVVVTKVSEPFDLKLEDTVVDIGPKPYCAKLSDEEQDAYLLPGTVRMKFSELIQSHGIAVDCHLNDSGYCVNAKHKENPRESCAFIFLHLSQLHQGVALARGRVEADALMSVPIVLSK